MVLQLEKGYPLSGVRECIEDDIPTRLPASAPSLVERRKLPKKSHYCVNTISKRFRFNDGLNASRSLKSARKFSGSDISTINSPSRLAEESVAKQSPAATAPPIPKQGKKIFKIHRNMTHSEQVEFALAIRSALVERGVCPKGKAWSKKAQGMKCLSHVTLLKKAKPSGCRCYLNLIALLVSLICYMLHFS